MIAVDINNDHLFNVVSFIFLNFNFVFFFFLMMGNLGGDPL